MHPAPSVIFFTTFSGLGFGLLTWLGLGAPWSDWSRKPLKREWMFVSPAILL